MNFNKSNSLILIFIKNPQVKDNYFFPVWLISDFCIRIQIYLYALNDFKKYGRQLFPKEDRLFPEMNYFWKKEKMILRVFKKVSMIWAYTLDKNWVSRKHNPLIGYFILPVFHFLKLTFEAKTIMVFFGAPCSKEAHCLLGAPCLPGAPF